MGYKIYDANAKLTKSGRRHILKIIMYMVNNGHTECPTTCTLKAGSMPTT